MHLPHVLWQSSNRQIFYREEFLPIYLCYAVVSRSSQAAALAIFIGHYMTKLISSSHAFHLTQTSIAVVSIALLVVMITMHHRMEGQLLTQTQEEAVLIGGFVLLWIAVLVAWRAFTTKNVGGSQTLAEMPSPCSSDVGYCIVEEYYY